MAHKWLVMLTVIKAEEVAAALEQRLFFFCEGREAISTSLLHHLRLTIQTQITTGQEKVVFHEYLNAHREGKPYDRARR